MAKENHYAERRNGYLDEHTTEIFTTCPHPDCVLVRAAVPVEEAAPPNASTRTLAMLDELAAKPELRVRGWDTYDGDPLDDRAVAAVRTFLGYPWAVVPSSAGGVQLEIHAMGFDVEIEFNADGTIETAYAETVADQAAASPGPVAGAVPAPQEKD